MPEHLLHRLDVCACRHREAGRGVPQVVRCSPWNARRSNCLGEPPRRGVWPPQMAAVIAGPQKVVTVLALALAAQIGQQEPRQRHGAPLVGFRSTDIDLLARLDGILGDAGPAPPSRPATPIYSSSFPCSPFTLFNHWRPPSGPVAGPTLV